MASFAEGLALAESGGLQQSDLIEAMGLGAIAAPMFALKVRCMKVAAPIARRTAWVSLRANSPWSKARASCF